MRSRRELTLTELARAVFQERLVYMPYDRAIVLGAVEPFLAEGTIGRGARTSQGELAFVLDERALARLRLAIETGFEPSD